MSGPIILIGPSGSGKSSLARQLQQQGMVTIVPVWTTRPARANETTTPEHHFVTLSEFNRRQQENYFIHTTQPFDLPHWYGLPLLPTSQLPLLICLRAWVIPLLQQYRQEVVIYHIEAPLPDLVQRLQLRQQQGELLGTRLLHIEEEIKVGRRLANRTFVNDQSIAQLSAQVAQAIKIDASKEVT